MEKQEKAVLGSGNRTRRWGLTLLVAMTVIASVAMSSSVGGKSGSDLAGATESSGTAAAGPNAMVSMPVSMAVDWKDGEPKTPAFEIKDFSFGVENPTTIGSATGGAGAGKIKFNEFTIKKTTDKASPLFFKNCATGAHIKEVTIDIRKADKKGNETPFMTFKFGTVFTTKIDWSGPGDEGPEESITFVYGTLTVVYHQFDERTGSFTDASYAWDQVDNKEALAGTD